MSIHAAIFFFIKTIQEYQKLQILLMLMISLQKHLQQLMLFSVFSFNLFQANAFICFSTIQYPAVWLISIPPKIVWKIGLGVEFNNAAMKLTRNGLSLLNIYIIHGNMISCIIRSQITVTCSNSAIETPEKCVEYVQS